MAKTKIGKVMILLKGDYDSSAQYIRLDAVKYQGSLYIARKDNVGIAPTNTEYWQLSAEKGDKPINGVDYNTEAEKEEFKEIIIADGKEAIDNYAESKKDELDAKEVELENSLEVKRDGLVETMEDVIDGFEQNVVEKTNAYNDNASSKTTIFNTNVENKTNAFNTNAETKTNEFNANSQEKTNSFNSNATSKTNAFDLNATNKTNQFDTNAETKTSEFDSNASEKLEDYNDNAIEKTEQFNENSTHLQVQVDNVAEQMPWKSTDWADEEIKVDDSFEYNSNKVEIKGRTVQQTYSGKNKYNTNLEKIKAANTQGVWNDNIYTSNEVTYTVNDDLSVLVNGTVAEGSTVSFLRLNDMALGFEGLVEGTEYTLNGCPEDGTASTYALRLYSENNIYKSEVGEGADFTYNTTIKYVRINVASGVSVNNVLFKPMITLKSETDKTFERFVGGIASPNIEFPQQIRNVSGDVVIKTYNKNRFDKTICPKYNKEADSITTLSSYYYNLISNKQGSSQVNPPETFPLFLKAKQGQKVCLSYKSVGGKSLTLHAINSNGNIDAGVMSGTASSGIYTATKDTMFSVFAVTNVSDTFSDIQVEFNEVTTPYVEHKESTATFPLVEGQYLVEGDYLADDYKIHHKRRNAAASEFAYVLRNTESGITTYSTTITDRLSGLASTGVDPHIISSHFYNRGSVGSVGQCYSGLEGLYWFKSTMDSKAIYLNSKINNLEDFKKFLTDNNVRIEYDTQEEWTEDMTPAQQLAYDKLKRMGGYKDITYVSATSDDLNPSFKFTYMTDLDVNGIKDKLIPAGGTKGQALVKKNDADSEVEWADVTDEGLSERVAELENVMSQMPSTEAEGTDFKLDNTIDATVLDVGVKGNTWQQTYTGKNILDINTPFSSINGGKSTVEQNKITVNSTKSATASAVVWSIDVSNLNSVILGGEIESGETPRVAYRIGEGSTTPLSSQIGKFEKTFDVSNTAEFRVYLYSYYNTEGIAGEGTCSYKDIMVSTTGGDYEPYVGGTASPNINFQQLIHNVSGEVKILNRNENLLIPDEFAQKIIDTPYKQNMSTYDEETGILDINMGNGSEIFSEFKKNTRYTIFLDLINTDYSGGINVQIVYTDGTTVALTNTHLPRYVTTSGKTVKSITHYASNSTGHRYINLFNSGIFEGNISVENFVKPQSSKATFPLEEGQYLAEGDYLADDHKIHHKWGIRIVDGKENWSASSVTIKENIMRAYFTISDMKKVTTEKSNYFTHVDYEDDKPGTNFYPYGASIASFRVPLSELSETTLNGFKKWFKDKYDEGKPVIIQYELATETTEDMTPAQIEAYNNLKKLRSYSGGTYVVTSSDDLAPVVKEKALVDIQAKFDELETRLLGLESEV